MANSSIYAAFERMWQHIIVKINDCIKLVEEKLSASKADWNINDPEADGYVKNKPFGTEFTITRQTVFEGTGIYNIEYRLGYIVNKSGIVTIDGIEYEGNCIFDAGAYKFMSNDKCILSQNVTDLNTYFGINQDLTSKSVKIEVLEESEVIKKLDEKYIPDIIGLDKKLNNNELTYAIELSDELIPATLEWSGEGWTQTEGGGFAHTVGSTEPLTITLSEGTGENLYLISFNIESATDTSSPDASVAVYPSIGGSDAFALYDGNTGTRTYEKIIRSVADGNLVFQPCDPKMPTDTTNGSFDGTIGNISVRRVLSVREANIVLYDENGNATIEMRQTPTARYNFYMGLNSGKNDVTGKGNVAIGKDTLPDNTSGFWNVALGQGALKANTVGSRNIAIGRVAMQENTSGDRNVAIGTFALCRSHGFRNIAIGADAAWNIAEGNDNIAIGVQAMESCTVGYKNTVIGSNAVYSAETNTKESVAVGYNAVHDAAYMDKCVVIGSDAGAKIAGAESIVAIGYHAFGSATRASRSVAIGDHAGNHSGTLNDVICIGNYSTATKTGQTVIGGARTVETVVKGDFIVLGTDGVKRQIVFNEDGTCSWTAVD